MVRYSHKSGRIVGALPPRQLSPLKMPTLRKSKELARLRERQRIAQALHDTMAQMLFSIGLETNCA